MRADLSLWTIYEKPRDFPHGYVARRWTIGEGTAVATNDVITGGELDEVRNALTARFPDLTPLARSPGDEPQIVETWI